jgi:hypothetical protein
MSVGQTRKKDNSSIPVVVALPKDKILKFIKDDLSSKAVNQINSLVRRREITKNYDLYNEKIKEVFLHELKKGSVA